MGTQNHEKWRFYTPNIWVITPKNEGCGFPWHLVNGMILQAPRQKKEASKPVGSAVDQTLGGWPKDSGDSRLYNYQW